MLSHGLFTCASHAPSSELDAPAFFVNPRFAPPEEAIIKWTQQDRSRTPSTPIWSSRLYKFAPAVRPTFQWERLHCLFNRFRLPKGHRLCQKKSRPARPGFFFDSFPRALLRKAKN